LNMEQAEAKIKELEDRIAALPGWKKKYESEHSKVEAIRTAFMTLFDSPLLLPQYTAKQSDVNLQEQQTIVHIAHEEKPVVMTTSTNVGKILFVALTELKDGFTSVELMARLAEHGWNVGPNTISPTVGGMVKDGYLVRLPDIKPTRYRTPLKVKFDVTEEP